MLRRPRDIGRRLRQAGTDAFREAERRVDGRRGGGSGRGGPPRPLDEIQAEVDGLVGLSSVKEQISTLIAFLRSNSERADRGLTEVPTSQHLVFLGNPGTGKTTMARLVAEMYGSIGLLEGGHLVEVDRAGSGRAVRRSHRVQDEPCDPTGAGGVLFIDEAYALSPPGPKSLDFGGRGDRNARSSGWRTIVTGSS